MEQEPHSDHIVEPTQAAPEGLYAWVTITGAAQEAAQFGQFAEELATHASALVSRYSPDTYARSLANAFRGLVIVNMQDL